MKRNIPIRVAGCLLVTTLLSTSMVSGTFAKYVVQDTATDTARVAKFGVVVNADGNLFSDTYKVASQDATSNTPATAGTTSLGASTLTVVSSSVTKASDVKGVNASSSNKVVAPGTQNTEGLTFSVTGTPEVAVKITFEASGSDVWLGAGTYPDLTYGDTFNDTYESTDTFTADSAYYPIKYTLSQKKSGDDNYSVVKGCDGVTLATIVDYLNNDARDVTYDANTDLSTAVGTYKLTWTWDYENTYSADVTTANANDSKVTVAKGAYDDRDTLLGDLAEGTLVASVVSENTNVTTYEETQNTTTPAMPVEVTAATDKSGIVSGTSALSAQNNSYSINADFAITIKVEQVD